MLAKKTRKKVTPSNPHSMDGVPTYFADQPAGILAGPYTTKITFGVTDDDGTDFPRPMMTIAMPTIHVIRMMDELRQIFDSPSFQQQAKVILGSDMEEYFSPKKPALNEAKRQRVKLIGNDTKQ